MERLSVCYTKDNTFKMFLFFFQDEKIVKSISDGEDDEVTYSRENTSNLHSCLIHLAYINKHKQETRIVLSLI